MLNRPQDSVYQGVMTDKDGDNVEFSLSSNDGQSSSFLPFSDLLNKIYPNIKYTKTHQLKTSRLDTVLRGVNDNNKYNLLVVDTQGADLMVLRGAGSMLDRFKAIFVEVSHETLYDGGAVFEEVNKFLTEKNFYLKHVHINNEGWGDAFYVKN
jgi:FkbM family methyltransferase